MCADQGYSGTKPAAVLPARPRSAPAGVTDPAHCEGIRAAILAQVGVLASLNAAIKALDRSLSETMQAHPDGAIFRSFRCAGIINAAENLAAWGDARDAFDHPDAVCAPAGITTVSGKQRGVGFRWAWRCWQNGTAYDPALHGGARHRPNRQVAA